MTDIDTRRPAAKAQALDPSELMPFAAAIPHARRLPKLFSPNQGFNSAEHRQLGDAVRNFGITDIYNPALGYNHPLELAPDLKLTYGQIVALGGDLYGVPDKPISSGKDDKDRRGRFEAAFNTLVHCDRKELAKILEIMDNEEKTVELGILEGKSADQAYADGPDFDQQYMDATGFVWPGIVEGRYLSLALKNFDHFGADAVTAYRIGHGRAIEEALAAYKERTRPGGSIDSANRTFERALAMSAFADHFLTDLFAAGHLRVPRRAVAADFAENYSAAIARHQHLEDNHFGLFVRNAKGRCWKCFGDGHFGTMQGYENRQLATQGIQTSYEEVFEAYRGAYAPPDFGALALVPQLDLVMDKEAGKTGTTALNFAPAFIMSGSQTEGRFPFQESDTHAWSRLHYRNFASDDRTSAAVLFNHAITGKSIEAIKTPHNVMAPPTSKPVLKGWRAVDRTASPIGDGVEVRWAVAFSEDKTYPNSKGTAANISALGPWSDYIPARAKETPVLSIPIDPTGRSTWRRIARQIKGRDPEFSGMGVSGNAAADWADGYV
jgi:hypothetical protein